MQQFVALTATNHAKIYGLTSKGSITVGNDADIAIWDPTHDKTDHAGESASRRRLHAV